MVVDIHSIPHMVINIAERKDRMDVFHKEYVSFFSKTNYANSDPKGYNRVDAEVGKPSKTYIAKSHKKCVQFAKNANAEFCLIMEDDLKFTSDKAYGYAIEALNNAPDDFDILLGGIYSHSKWQKTNNYWNEVYDFCSAHFYILSAKAYDKILAFNESDHIDRWFSTGGKLKCYVTPISFVVQHNGYSDNVDKEVDYDNYLKRYTLL